MPSPIRIALTADLHWGPHSQGNEASLQLAAFLEQHPPELLILAGDIGATHRFGPCLELFRNLHCRKALVPGNHDIWVEQNDPRGDSLQVYHEHLPSLCREHGFHYLDQGPLLLPEVQLAIVGTINWYDYSWSLRELQQQVPDWEQRLQTKRFTRGRHNDANYVRWNLDDEGFTTAVVAAFRNQLEQALAQAPQAIVVAHHPPFRGLNYPQSDAPTTDGLLWQAFSGNQRLEDLLMENASRIPLAFCGHTHRARENTLGPIRGFNIGGDYHFKRLLVLDWPAGTVEAYTFGELRGT
jgi:3',5'-cyclic AMP phosphodiesterase CpdA